ncbi:MAG: hypothetical protein AB1861_20850 [Cyanobacteriota bacterium]
MIDGFVIIIEGGYLGQDGGTSNDLQSARDWQEYEEAEAIALGVDINPDWIAEFVIVDGQRQLAYENAAA